MLTKFSDVRWRSNFRTGDFDQTYLEWPYTSRNKLVIENSGKKFIHLK